MKSLLIYININNLITTQNCEPIFTRRPTISKQPATLLTKESEIEISNQQPKNEVKRNPSVGLDCGRLVIGLVATLGAACASPNSQSFSAQPNTTNQGNGKNLPTSNPFQIPTTIANPPSTIAKHLNKQSNKTNSDDPTTQ